MDAVPKHRLLYPLSYGLAIAQPAGVEPATDVVLSGIRREIVARHSDVESGAGFENPRTVSTLECRATKSFL